MCCNMDYARRLVNTRSLCSKNGWIPRGLGYVGAVSVPGRVSPLPETAL